MRKLVFADLRKCRLGASGGGIFEWCWKGICPLNKVGLLILFRLFFILSRIENLHRREMTADRTRFQLAGGES